MMLNIDGVEFPDFPAPLTTEERKEALEFLKGYIAGVEGHIRRKMKLSVRASLYFSRDMKVKIVADCESFYLANKESLRFVSSGLDNLYTPQVLGCLVCDWRDLLNKINTTDYACRSDEHLDRLRISCGEGTDFPPLNIYQNVDGLLYFL